MHLRLPRWAMVAAIALLATRANAGADPAAVRLSQPAATAAAPRPGADLNDCFSCHRTLIDGRKPHAPLKGGDCATCHTPAPAGTPGKCKSPKASAWKLVAEQPALCAKCHDTSGAAPAHPVIKSQGCTACHDPHASSNPSLTKIWPVVALCYKCHSKYDDAEFIHTAVKKGQCLGCHSPHAGDAKPLLIDSREALCASCHKTADVAKQHEKHAPVLEGRCLDCHDPHRADYPAQVVEKGKKLCLTCHDAKAKPGPAAASMNFRIDLGKKVVHKPLVTGDCQDCHTQAHSSENPGLLAKPVIETCFKCHTKFDELYKYQHGAAKLGDCAVCHEPHSSDNRGLLTATGNALCFKCHQDDLKGRAWVHKPIADKGCTACHDAHGADYRFNLTDGDGNDLCLKCHKGVGVKAKVKHLALDRYGCIACHDPHGADQPQGLRKATNDLCISCHAAQADGSHVGTAHKVEGGVDPRRAGKAFSCTSCHNPHGSDNPKLFYKGANAQEMCTSCHADRIHP
jgi:predicted CXXCH cytochrome family protein